MDASALASAESWLSWIAIAKLVATFLVAAGVVIEFGTDWISRPFEKMVKEAREAQLAALNNETAQLSAGTEKLRAENLALQTVLLPRHVGLIGFNEEPRAKVFFAGLEKFTGTEISIQVVPGDLEAQNLANEIAIVLQRFGWKPQMIDDNRSHFRSVRISEGVDVLYPIGKSWTAEEPHQPWFVWHDAAEALSNALTKAGLAVGDRNVSVAGFTNEQRPDLPVGLTPYFDPPLTGVYLTVGSRPVAATVTWIMQGRPDRAGNIPASAATVPKSQ